MSGFEAGSVQAVLWSGGAFRATIRSTVTAIFVEKTTNATTHFLEISKKFQLGVAHIILPISAYFCLCCRCAQYLWSLCFCLFVTTFPMQRGIQSYGPMSRQSPLSFGTHLNKLTRARALKVVLDRCVR